LAGSATCSDPAWSFFAGRGFEASGLGVMRVRFGDEVVKVREAALVGGDWGVCDDVGRLCVCGRGRRDREGERRRVARRAWKTGVRENMVVSWLGLGLVGEDECWCECKVRIGGSYNMI
jgi:hypothetical protein